MVAITAGLMTTTCIVFHDVQVLAFKAVPFVLALPRCLSNFTSSCGMRLSKCTAQSCWRVSFNKDLGFYQVELSNCKIQ